MKANSKCQNDDCVVSGECHYPHTNECKLEFEHFEWSAMQIAVYAINCQNLDRYVDEVTQMIENYANRNHDNGFSLGYEQCQKDLKERQ